MLEEYALKTSGRRLAATNDGHFGGEKKASGKYEYTIVNGAASA